MPPQRQRRDVICLCSSCSKEHTDGVLRHYRVAHWHRQRVQQAVAQRTLQSHTHNQEPQPLASIGEGSSDTLPQVTGVLADYHVFGDGEEVDIVSLPGSPTTPAGDTAAFKALG
jgi:hypothetical protein